MMTRRKRDRVTIAAARAHARTAKPVYPTTTRLVRPVGNGADWANGRKDASR